MLHLYKLHMSRAPLLPKVRGYFAEFLKESYLARLSILYLPTCGGLRYGLTLNSHTKLFLAAGHQSIQFLKTYASYLRLTATRICLRNLPTYLHPLYQSWADLAFCVIPLLKHSKPSAGISTCLPSTTPFGLALGPD